MKRKLSAVVLLLCLLPVLVLPVCASSAHVVDEAGLLTRSELAALEAKLSEISSRQGMDIVIVTVDSTGWKSPMDYADDYYDYNGYRDDGILLLISMEDRDWWISTAGYGITAFTDAGLEYISDRVVPSLSDGEYAQAFNDFAELCDEFISQAKTGAPYDSHNLPKEPFAFVRNLLIALVIGLVVALLVTGHMKSQLKTVRSQTKADDYVTAGSMQLTRSSDLLLYTNLHRRKKPQNNGSSTHRSSSGRSHGGRGGRF